MNKRQKLQTAVGILFTVLLIIWIFLPAPLDSRLLGLTGNALGLLSMIFSYRAEEKNKKKLK